VVPANLVVAVTGLVMLFAHGDLPTCKTALVKLKGVIEAVLFYADITEDVLHVSNSAWTSLRKLAVCNSKEKVRVVAGGLSSRKGFAYM
jgi:hypothetical protein